MNEIFNFHGQEVRTLTIDDEPWFVGKDVADILGYAKPLDAISRHVDEDDSVKYGLTDNLGRTQNTIIINESGLYSLILSSKLPQAKEFKRWVTSEVLPAIRKQGGFIREDLDEDAFIALFTGQKKLREQQTSMLEDIDYLKSEQPIHPSYAQSLLKKRRLGSWLAWVVLIALLMRIRFLLSQSLDKLRLTLKTTSTLVAMTCYRKSLQKQPWPTG